MKKSRLLGAVCAGLIFFSSIFNSAASAPILDQIADSPLNLTTMPFGSLDIAQTFTVGITGQLTRVDLKIGEFGFGTPEVVHIDIRPTINGVPIEDDNSFFAQTALLPSEMSGTSIFTEIDFSSANIIVSIGDVLAIALRSDAPPTHPEGNTYVSPLTEGYVGGDRFFRGTSSTGTSFPTWTTQSSPDLDLKFRTFVNPIPIPSAIWLFGSGLLGLIGIARKKEA